MTAIAYHTTASGLAVAEVQAGAPALRDGQDLLNLFFTPFDPTPDWIALPTSALPPAFFDLKSGLAGEMLQKTVNYRRHVAVLGDVSAHTDACEAFAALVRESNRGKDVWFLSGIEELLGR